MIDFSHNLNCQIFDELPKEELKNWFDYKQKKFLRNIDTFYYTVMFDNIFMPLSEDKAVLAFREIVSEFKEKLFKGYDEIIPFHLPGLNSLSVVKRFFNSGMYNFCLDLEDEFTIFFAPIVPPGKDGVSVTPPCLVQIRSKLLWTFGHEDAFQKSFKYIEAISSKFGFRIKEVVENRVDYCFHSNYFQNPSKFWTVENLYKYRVDRYKGAHFNTFKSGSENFETDYISIGRKDQDTFIRIYNKTKEVIEMGYKCWFFKVWFLNELISRYDLYCYEEAYKNKSYKYLYIARLKWYLENGNNELVKDKCRKFINQYETKTSKIDDNIMNFCDSITPKLNIITNVEYQVRRKESKTYKKVPFRDNSKYGSCKEIYDYFDNIGIITDYLTSKTFRLVSGDDPNKSRRDYHPFWAALRASKMIDVKKIRPEQIPKKFRQYDRKLNAEVIKRKISNSAVTLGIYAKGKNKDSVGTDIIQAISCLNDNDIKNAMRYKEKRKLQLSSFFDTPVTEILSDRSISIVDDDGIIFNEDNIDDFFLRDSGDIEDSEGEDPEDEN